MRFKPLLNVLSMTILWCGGEVCPPTVALGGDPPSNGSSDDVQWVDSDDGTLALRLSIVSSTVAADAEIEITAQIRNLRQTPITVLRPIGDWYEAEASGIKIWNETRRIRYTGPKVDYVINKDGFAVVAPGATIEDKMKLTAAHFSGIEASGTYAVRYDYSYNGDWDSTTGIRGAWRGTVSSREVLVTRK